MSSKLTVGTHLLTILALYPGQPLTSEQLACSVNTNPVVIRRILGLLRDAGYVDSKHGVGGGWVLLADPARITLLDIFRAVEPQQETFALHRCEPDQACLVGRNIQKVLTELYHDVQQAMDQHLASSSIASVVAAVKERGDQSVNSQLNQDTQRLAASRSNLSS